MEAVTSPLKSRITTRRRRAVASRDVRRGLAWAVLDLTAFGVCAVLTLHTVT
jgi:hypothetical protein